ncbi:MAG: preprotein translocase subunit SecF [Candidatus Binatota bacterium]|jgi:preprotein translocase subunit SecF|nr:preprotein translocase subunit SecF [Candidatus Binatota bacterium]
MQLIPPDTKFDFVKQFPYAMAASSGVVLIALLALVIRGPRYGIDFEGGTMVHVRFQEKVQISDIRAVLDPLSDEDFTVQDFGGSSNEFLIRLAQSDPQLKTGLTDRIKAALQKAFGGKAGFEILRVESVGPRVGKDLRQRAVFAVLAATVMMGAYIWLRFELRFGIGAAVALFHDVGITVGALTLMQYEFDLTIVAALLTIVGFSVNDTVIVSDRIRENMRKNRREPLASLINRSINETLSRTILTTGTVLVVVFALYVLGGEVIHGFAFALLVGFTFGTYSSIFIASPIVLYIRGKPAVPAKAAAKTKAARP